jgi:hypothetical protein
MTMAEQLKLAQDMVALLWVLLFIACLLAVRHPERPKKPKDPGDRHGGNRR